MKFLKASAWRNFHSLQLLGSSNQNVLLSRSFGNLGLDIGIVRKLFLPSNLKKKKRIFMFCIVLSYGISTTLLQILISLCIHSKASIGVLEKAIWTFRSIRPLVFWKYNCSENFCILDILSSKTFFWVIFKYTRTPSWDFSKKLFRAAILQAGIYPSNLDVCYSAQRTLYLFVLLLKYWSSFA